MVIAGIPFTMPAIWIGLIVIFLVIEGLTAGLVTEDIDNLTGRGAVTVGGKVWTARAQGDTPIAAGTTATVLRIEGVKLIVTPVCVRADANE